MRDDLVRCHVDKKADIRFHDGGLPHVTGACCYQVVRCAGDRELSPEGRGFTYNHAGMLAWFKGAFVMEYLAGPRGEHEFPSAAYVCFSPDGILWEKPKEAFPPVRAKAEPYRGPKKELVTGDTIPCIVHHRMGFFTTRDNRLLVSTFYGISPDHHLAPNNGYGVGRAVREIYEDHSMSPVYMLRYNEAGGYSRDTELFPWFEDSEDQGFADGCRELLKDPVVTQQWWEEERLDKDFFTCTGGRAMSCYTLPDGRIMAVFKDSLTSCSGDGGKSWSPLRPSVSLETASGKVWGQKTADGKYALAYNPSPDGAHRWPLAVMWGDNGEDFFHLSAAVPEISPCRCQGALKNLGAQYMRGITEANAHPDDQAMWLAYSVNKEDMWVCRIPVPMDNLWRRDVEDHMDSISDETLRNTWNLYVPSWNQARLEQTEEGKRGLLLADADPYNRTRAMRKFRPGKRVKISARLVSEGIWTRKAAVFVQDISGQNLVSLVLRPDRKGQGGHVCLRQGGYETALCRFLPGKEIGLSMEINCIVNKMEVTARCGESAGERKDNLGASAWQAERILFATKYSLPFQGLEDNGKDGTIGDLPGADEKHEETRLFILELECRTIEV